MLLSVIFSLCEGHICCRFRRTFQSPAQRPQLAGGPIGNFCSYFFAGSAQCSPFQFQSETVPAPFAPGADQAFRIISRIWDVSQHPYFSSETPRHFLTSYPAELDFRIGKPFSQYIIKSSIKLFHCVLSILCKITKSPDFLLFPVILLLKEFFPCGIINTFIKSYVVFPFVFGRTSFS